VHHQDLLSQATSIETLDGESVTDRYVDRYYYTGTHRYIDRYIETQRSIETLDDGESVSV